MDEGESSCCYILEFPFRLQYFEELTCSLFAIVFKCAARSDIKVHFVQERHSNVWEPLMVMKRGRKR